MVNYERKLYNVNARRERSLLSMHNEFDSRKIKTKLHMHPTKEDSASEEKCNDQGNLCWKIGIIPFKGNSTRHVGATLSTPLTPQQEQPSNRNSSLV